VNAQNYAPRVFAGLPDREREGYGLADFKQAMEGLFRGHKIKSVDYGRKGDKRKRIERCDREE
jgi:hypothetical protein